MKLFLLVISLFYFIAFPFFSLASSKKSIQTTSYHLSIDYKMMNIKGLEKRAMAINDSIPAPTLYFTEGDQAVIYVTNKMDVETSVHWHGVLLPNFQDGVPYLTSPPIRPGKTHKFEFVLRQDPGTYWYHSHTGLQEQEGLFGAIVIESKQKNRNYDHNLVFVLSDWTNENPKEVLRSLKKGSEWYSIKKGTLQSLFDVIKGGALASQFQLWKQRMPGMDISDIYYDAFLLNGKIEQNYPQFKSKEVLRIRVINAAASTYFWLTFGGNKARLVSADGIDVRPVFVEKLLHAVAETYDFILEIPSGKAVEFKATAQDGSGSTTALIGKGIVLKATHVPKPDLIKEMKIMAKHHSKHMGSHQSHKNHKKQAKRNQSQHHKKQIKMDHSQHQNRKHQKTSEKKHQFASHYDYLKSIKKTNFSKNIPVKEIEMNLTGNMWRYVWSINGKVLSESDKIKIHRGEITRMILNNKTMMRHPMHLHGHFFRVLNKNGKYSPLKHTVDVPPMTTVIIEFDSKEMGDWFFHCHILYHMKGGMARVLSYGNKRDKRLKKYPFNRIFDGDRQWFQWAEMSFMSNRFDWEYTISNTRNKAMLEGILSWLNNDLGHFEFEATYEYFFSDFFRLYVGADIENHTVTSFSDIKKMEPLGRFGMRYLLPYFVELDISLDHKTEIQISLSYELMLLSRLEFFTEWKLMSSIYNLDKLFMGETIQQEWSLGLEYIINKNLSFISSYDNRFHFGAGIHLNF